MEDEQKDPAADFGGKSISGVLTKGKSDKDPAAEFGGISVSGTVKKKITKVVQLFSLLHQHLH